jgi:hypothetical protein
MYSRFLSWGFWRILRLFCFLFLLCRAPVGICRTVKKLSEVSRAFEDSFKNTLFLPVIRDILRRRRILFFSVITFKLPTKLF